MKIFFATLPEIAEQRAVSGRPYREFLRVPNMSAGLFVLPAGGTDHQKPHREDEIYYVIRGRARFKAGFEDREVSGGSLIFVSSRGRPPLLRHRRRARSPGLLRACRKLTRESDGLPDHIYAALGLARGSRNLR
ncbi:MAG: hypothetical protein WBQ85_03085 [Candidatus Sulfotelmatobacter sp.]